MDDFSVGGMFGRYREEGFDFAGRSRGGEEYARDIFFQGTADDGVTELAEALGWKVRRQACDEGVELTLP